MVQVCTFHLPHSTNVVVLLYIPIVRLYYILPPLAQSLSSSSAAAVCCLVNELVPHVRYSPHPPRQTLQSPPSVVACWWKSVGWSIDKVVVIPFPYVQFTFYHPPPPPGLFFLYHQSPWHICRKYTVVHVLLKLNFINLQKPKSRNFLRPRAAPLFPSSSCH